MAVFEMFRCFRDGMVLQRDTKVNIWGFAEKGTELSLLFLEKTYTAVAGDDGEFVFEVQTGAAGGPYSMIVTSGSDSITINDILFGDVYVISGQSNMELPMERTIDLTGERIDSINYPLIREFRIPLQINFGVTERQFPSGEWLKADSREDILKMSATGFNFAENVYLSENIPIGLVNNSIGGTPIEAHLPEKILRPYGQFNEAMDRNKNPDYVSGVQKFDMDDMEDWYTELNKLDKGLDGDNAVYAAEDFDDSSWKQMTLPNTFFGTELEHFYGSLWFRKEFYIPEDCLLDDALLRVGVLIDGDDTYLNGTLVGKVDYKYPPRRYFLPKGVLMHGRNVVTVRLICNRNTGGFIKDKRYCVQGSQYVYEGGYMGNAAMPDDADPANGRWEVDLSGEWKYTIGTPMRELPLMTFFQYEPSALYNGMMHPILKYSFKGGLWYQGESNSGNPKDYAKYLKELVGCWRLWFGDDFSFIAVQLPEYDDPSRMEPIDSWAILREEVRRVSGELGIGMAVTIDVGEHNDIHPQKKADIGKRLSMPALALIYGKDIEYIGPVLTSAYNDCENGSVELEFSHCEGGLNLVNDRIGYFEIGTIATVHTSDNGFDIYDDMITWNKAQDVAITGDNKLSVKYDNTLRNVVAVRYAWCNCPEHPPLYNKAKLPASPFAVFVS